MTRQGGFHPDLRKSISKARFRNAMETVMGETQFARTHKQLGKDARDTIGDGAATTVEDLNQRVSDVAAEAGAAVREAARRVSGAASELGQQALDRGNRYGKDVLAQVESQPVASLVVAAAVGFIAGCLFARR
jgi:ElaB/YqjD/DUF883 family membrane-anchored ribosome-binding protein